MTFVEFFRELWHLAAYTGLSLGAIALLVLVAIYVPFFRVLAIALALAVAAGYCSGIYMHKIGRNEVTAEWDAANARAAEDAKDRDKQAAAEIESKYGPVIASQDETIADLQNRIEAYERGLTKGGTSGNCTLGAGALRLCGSRQARHSAACR